MRQECHTGSFAASVKCLASRRRLNQDQTKNGYAPRSQTSSSQTQPEGGRRHWEWWQELEEMDFFPQVALQARKLLVTAFQDRWWH